jgi:hypothetical protein
MSREYQVVVDGDVGPSGAILRDVGPGFTYECPIAGITRREGNRAADGSVRIAPSQRRGAKCPRPDRPYGFGVGQRTKSSRPPSARSAASVQSPTEIER